MSSQKNIIPIIFATNNNYSMPLLVTITSIFKNADESDFFKIYILCNKNNLSFINKKLLLTHSNSANCQIDFVDTSDIDFDKLPQTADCAHISKETYYRYAIPQLFKNYDKILYLDCDIVVKSSLKELFDTDIEDYYFAGIEDILSEDNKARLGLGKYCNAGIMLLNLKKMREDNIEEKLFDYTMKNQDKILWQDQDVMNVVMQDGIFYLPLIWNVQVFDWENNSKFHKIIDSAKIIHFVGCIKPWDIEAKSDLRKEFYKYYNMTPFSSRILSVTRFSLIGFLKHIHKIIKNFRKKIIWYSKKEKRVIVFGWLVFRLK